MRLGTLAAAILACWAGSAQAGDTTLTFPAGTVSVPVVSMKEARFKGVVRQEHDFSCGSAALATLLTHHYGRPTTEREVFEAMFAAGDRDAIERFGFSMADMKRYLTSVGYRAEGYRVSLDKLAKAGIPAITLITIQGYSHFVVIKGIEDGKVLVGDPALGVRIVPRDEFTAMWVGVIFVIHDQYERGREHFNDAGEWRSRKPKAPMGAGVPRQGLETFSVLRPGPFQF